MAKENITIKDIAARAGVSTGTVDRVLHKRPNVSKSALEKVNKALEELDYRPNMYASALAYNKTYTFYVVLPKHEQDAYWDEIEEGAQACCQFRRDFGITLKFVYYERFNAAAFTKMVREFLTAKIDGVIIVPATLEQTARFTEKLTDRQIPYVLLDSYMPDLKPLSFFGQDSFASGYFAAKMLMLIAGREKEVALVKQTRDGKVASKQQANRETGFRHYMMDHFPEIKITEVDLPLDEEHKEYDSILEKFFKEHPLVHHCITFNSKASLRSILWCITASPSTRRHISWDHSCSAPTVETSRSWATIWCRRMKNACVMAASPSLLPSMPISRATPVSMPSSTLLS